jgi:hypothetical protein
MQKVLKEIHNSSSILVFNRRKWKGHWWPSWTSNPVGGVSNVFGGFDSHALPPYFNEAGSLRVKEVMYIFNPLNPSTPELLNYSKG